MANNDEFGVVATLARKINERLNGGVTESFLMALDLWDVARNSAVMPQVAIERPITVPVTADPIPEVRVVGTDSLGNELAETLPVTEATDDTPPAPVLEPTPVADRPVGNADSFRNNGDVPELPASVGTLLPDSYWTDPKNVTVPKPGPERVAAGWHVETKSVVRPLMMELAKKNPLTYDELHKRLGVRRPGSSARAAIARGWVHQFDLNGVTYYKLTPRGHLWIDEQELSRH